MANKLVLANHFDLSTVCGTTVMFAEVLRIAPREAPAVAFAYESYERHPSPEALRKHLDTAHRDASCIVAVNAHIEVRWDLSEALFAWGRERGIPACVYAHDYWPQHADALRTLVAGHGARVIASTPFVAGQLGDAGFAADLVEVGVPLPDLWPPVGPSPSPKVIASAGRLVSRKRLADVVRGYAESGVEGRARLYLRALPSNVFDAASDAAQMDEIRGEIARAGLAGVVVDREAGAPPDYAAYAIYVCPSRYEGFSMTVVEAAFHGCPPLMSDIPPHRRTAQALFGEQAPEFLFPVGDVRALGRLIADEIASGRRKQLVLGRIDGIRDTIRDRFSLARTTRALARLATGT